MLKMPRIAEEWKRVHGREWTKEDVDKVYELSESSIMDVLINHADPKPYLLETIDYLKKNGIKVGSTTGYTDEMMAVVTVEAAKKGYTPDAWFSPNSVGDKGRPYPFMIFKNLEALEVTSVNAAIKVGDTISDIKEGKNAGLISVGVTEGSSVMGLSEEEFNTLSQEEKNEANKKAATVFSNCGADYVINNLSELPDLIEKIQK